MPLPMEARWIQRDDVTLLDDNGRLKVRLDPAGDLTATAQGITTVHDAFIRPDGSVVFTANQDMGGFRLTNLGLPVDGGDAPNKDYVDSAVSNLNVREVETFDLTDTDISNKKVVLALDPVSPEDVLAIVDGAPGLVYGVDFTIINGNEFSWDGYGLDGVLRSGDQLIVVYDRSNVSGGVHDKFLGLDDTPTSYIGEAGKVVAVNSAENGLEFRERDRFEVNTLPDVMSLDTTDTGVSFGTLFGVFKSVDFSPTEDGAVWLNFEFPSFWDYTRDILFKLTYSFDGVDTGNVCALEAQMWAVADGQSADTASPTYTITESITATTDSEGKRFAQVMSSIKFPASQLNTTNNQSIALRLKRDTSVSNNHSATWKLVSVVAFQQ